MSLQRWTEICNVKRGIEPFIWCNQRLHDAVPIQPLQLIGNKFGCDRICHQRLIERVCPLNLLLLCLGMVGELLDITHGRPLLQNTFLQTLRHVSPHFVAFSSATFLILIKGLPPRECTRISLCAQSSIDILPSTSCNILPNMWVGSPCVAENPNALPENIAPFSKDTSLETKFANTMHSGNGC